LAPAKTDPAIIDKIYKELQKIAKSPDVIKRLVNEGGNDMVMSSPVEFESVIKAELAVYGKLIKENNITPD